MRKITTIKIDDREFTLKELTVRQVWGLVNDDQPKEKVVAGQEGMQRLESFLKLACPELTRDIAMDMAPSELDTLWKSFKEVNTIFLEIADKAGLGGELMAQIRDTVRSSIVQSVISSVPGMESPSGPTDTASL